jgi:hypothetical protein
LRPDGAAAAMAADFINHEHDATFVTDLQAQKRASVDFSCAFEKADGISPRNEVAREH